MTGTDGETAERQDEAYAARRRGIGGRVREFIGWDDDWRREPAPGYLRRDILVALVTWLTSALMMEASRSMGGFLSAEPGSRPPEWWVPQVAVATACLIYVFRRRFPLSATLLIGVHMFVCGLTSPMTMAQFPLQALYFLAIFTGTAWGRQRRLTVVVIGLIIDLMLVWVVWQLVDASAAKELQEFLDKRGLPRPGIADPMLGAIVYSLMLNVFYFGAAYLSGQLAWRNARARAGLTAQADVIRGQSEELQEYAVTRERLRIARELHDVVAHHVAVIGVQAGAARKQLDKNPEKASSALRTIEGSSREAVAEMRSLLGTLRGEGAPGGEDRAPQPGLTEIASLVDQAGDGGLDVSYSVRDDLGRGLDTVPPAVALTLHRVAQEALTNIRKHSTATSATVVLRLGTARGASEFAEIEVVDDGRPIAGSSGSRLGQQGMRERVGAHGGVLEVGPRPNGGYRVRARLPIRHRQEPA